MFPTSKTKCVKHFLFQNKKIVHTFSQFSVCDFPDFLIIPSDCEKCIGHLETGDKFPGVIQPDLTVSRIRFT